MEKGMIVGLIIGIIVLVLIILAIGLFLSPDSFKELLDKLLDAARSLVP